MLGHVQSFSVCYGNLFLYLVVFASRFAMLHVCFVHQMCMEWDSVSWMSSWERDVSSRALPEVSLN